MKKNFTIIELLVVISIIAILAAILMPALGKARNRSISLQCMSQLKQFGLTLHQYDADHFFLPYGTAAGTYTITDFIAYTASTEESAWTAKSGIYYYLSPYLGKNRTVGRCPGMIPYNNIKFRCADEKATYAWYIGASRLKYPRKIDDPCERQAAAYAQLRRRPSRVWLMVDCHINDTILGPHSAKANRVYADGHVGQTLSSSYGAMIGQLIPEL